MRVVDFDLSDWNEFNIIALNNKYVDKHIWNMELNTFEGFKCPVKIFLTEWSEYRKRTLVIVCFHVHVSHSAIN